MGLADWLNRHVAPFITALGVTPRSVTLEVRGRRTGRPIRLSISPARFQDEDYLVSLAGERGWVKNVRAAGGEAVIVHGGRTPVRLREVPVEKRAPILLAYVQRRAFTRSRRRAARLYFRTANPTLERMEAVAADYPVFAIEERP
jgi:deazaflavin-dependent oxidoreductase (nitroreductase family)